MLFLLLTAIIVWSIISLDVLSAFLKILFFILMFMLLRVIVKNLFYVFMFFAVFYWWIKWFKYFMNLIKSSNGYFKNRKYKKIPFWDAEIFEVVE
jgi:hypothetical protein